MKTRSGFVSNSSTSSFCIFGVETQKKDLIELLKLEPTKTAGCRHEFDRSSIKFCPECGRPAWNEYPPSIEDIEESFNGKWEIREDEDGCYIGVPLQGLTVSELSNLKESSVELEEKFGKQPKVYSGAWYNG